MNIKYIKKMSKEYWKKFWYLIWEDESLWGWIISLIFAFLLIKFVFFPATSLIMGTSMPLVVVESNSMHHPGNFLFNYFGSDKLFVQWWQISSEWYTGRGIDFENALEWSLKNGLEIGDVIIVTRPKDLKIGDIIIFEGNYKYPIIHRIVDIYNINDLTVYSTKGDNNPGQLQIEQQISQDAIIGKAIFRIPLIGWVKLIFVKFVEIILR